MPTFIQTMNPTPWGYWNVSLDRCNLPGVYILVFAKKYFYIGSSNKCSHRINQHFCDVKKNKHNNSWFSRVCQKYKDEIKEFFIYCSNRQEAFEKEQELLDFHYKDTNCLNLSSIAIVPSMSESGLSKLKECAKKQHKEKRFGHEKVIEWNKSERARKIKSESAKKQRENPEYVKWLYERVSLIRAKEYNIWLVNPEGEKVILQRNLSEFCKMHGLDKANLGRVLCGKANSHKGWRLL